MPHVIDFVTVSPDGLESSPVAVCDHPIPGEGA